MKKIREVLRLRIGNDASVRDVAQSCRLAASTVMEYLYRAGVAGFGWPLPDELSDDELEKALFPPRPKKSDPPRPAPDWNWVRSELSRKGVTLLLVWREYRKQHPDGYGYSRFAELFGQWEKSGEVRMRQRHKAGEKLFVDYSGLKFPVVERATGEVLEKPVFVAAMGSSQKLFAIAQESETTANWLDGHVRAFEFYGALPHVLVPDNCRTAVTEPCYYEPGVNEAYADLARFYELTVLPARVRKPRDKAKVENGVLQVERWVLAPLRNRTFFSLAEANEAIAGLLAELNARVMKGPQLSRNQLFEQEDLPAMRPLPPRRYSFAQWKRLKVAPDHHVEFEGHFYSAPYALTGKHIDLRISVGTVEVFYSGKRLASHLRSFIRGRFTTLDEHMPEGHRQSQWTPERIVRWAGAVGPQTAAFVQALLERKVHPEHGYRMSMGTVRLEKRFGKERLEAACAKALASQALTYKSVKSILEKNLEQATPELNLAPLPTHDNVRGGGYYVQGGEPCVN